MIQKYNDLKKVNSYFVKLSLLTIEVFSTTSSISNFKSFYEEKDCLYFLFLIELIRRYHRKKTFNIALKIENDI